MNDGLRLSGRTTALLAIVTANVLGGASYLAQKLALAGLPPATVILVRNVVALAAMWGWIRLSGGMRGGYSAGEWVRMSLIGLLAFASPLLLGILGVQWSTASNGSILVLLEPASVLFFSWLLLRERVRAVQIVGIAVALSGALAIVFEGASPADLFAGRHLSGNAVLALHGILWGLYTPLAKPLVARHRPLEITFVSMLIAMLLLVPAGLLESGRWEAGPHLASALAWSVGMGLLVSFAATVLWVVSLRHLSASSVAGFIFIQPLVGVLAGFLFLGERLTPAAWIGSGLIVTGVVLVAGEWGGCRAVQEPAGAGPAPTSAVDASVDASDSGAA